MNYKVKTAVLSIAAVLLPSLAFAYTRQPDPVGVMIRLLFMMFMFLIFAGVPALVCGSAAKAKGLNSVSFFLLALFFTPVVGFLAVIAFPARK